MMTSKLVNTWELLLTNDFKEQFPKEFHCTICKNVTIEPYVASCECKYCSNCIKKYLNEGGLFCPGGKTECFEEKLKIEVNVLRDILGIRSITKLKVKCPNKMCDARRTLDSMGDHIRICEMSSVKCPYEMMGCNEEQIPTDNIKTHYDNKWFTHSQLLVEAIDNLRNDVRKLNSIVEKGDKQINRLLQDSDQKKEIIMKMEQQIDDQRKQIEEQNKIINILNEKYESKENDMEIMREEVRVIKEVDILEIKQIFDEPNQQLCVLNVLSEKRDNDLEIVKEKLSIIKKRQKKIMEDVEQLKKDIIEIDFREEITNQKKTLIDLKSQTKGFDKRIISAINAKVAYVSDEREFYWKVDTFSTIKGNNGRWKRIVLWKYSLKFNLSLWCEGGDLIFYCRILKGEFDNLLEWPMKHQITLSIINQNNMKEHKRCIYHYDTFHNKSAFDKPTDEWNNYYIGDDSFIPIKELSEFPGILVNDTLIVSFVINHKK